MSDKHLQTRKNLTLQSGIFGVSSLALLGTSGVKIITTLLGTGLMAIFGTFSFWALLAYILFSIPMIRGAFKSFSDLDYGKANQKSWLASLSTIALVLLDYMVFM